MFTNVITVLQLLATVTLFLVSNVKGQMTGEDTIFAYPYYGDECISECGSDGTCKTMKGYNYYCSSKFGYTYNNKKCGGACVPGHSWYYCYTEGGSYDYCSLHIKRPRVTHFGIYGDRCISSCHNFGGTSYNWCSIGKDMKKQECSKDADTTYQGERCTSTCSSWEGRYYFCNTATSWDYCGLVVKETVNPIVLKVWPRQGGQYSAQLMGQIDSSSIPSPERVTVQLGDNDSCDPIRRRRGITDQCPWAPRTTEQTLDELFDQFRTQAAGGSNNMHVEHYWDPNGSNSVDTVYRRVFNPSQNLTRTEGITAVIHGAHVRQNDRVDFTASAKNYMRRNLNYIPNVDEAGHLVMAALGGPPETYNLVPQHASVNRNAGSLGRPAQWANDWRSVENRMVQFFRGGQPGADGGHIRFRVAVFYINGNTGRPHMFQYLAQFYDRDGQEIDDSVWYPLPGVWQNRQG